MKLHFIRSFAILVLAATALHAQVPQLINYQGRVAVDGLNFDGTGQFKFAFVSAAGTTTYWSNDGTSTAGAEPTASVALSVSKGLYSVLLGDATLPGMTIVPATVFTHGDVHLRVWFNDGPHGFQLLTPDKRIAAVGYAMIADSVVDGAITAAKVADSAITTSKIADGAVTSAKLAPGVVQTGNLADGAVGNAQLANSGLTVTAGTGLSGGGPVSLGGTVSLANAGVLSLTGGGGITVDASTGALTLGSTATSANTASTLVARDASGNFSAGTITAALSGNATTATSTPSFTGTLAGDVTGTQGATAIAASTILGKSITGYSSGAGTLTTADTLLSAINKLDGNTALKAPLASPTFTGSVTFPAGSISAAPIQLQSGASLTTPVFGAVEFDGTHLFVTTNSATPTRKTLAFTDSIISSGQIATGAVDSSHLASGLTLSGTTSGTFSGPLTGNVTGNVTGSAASFTEALVGDVTGTQGATVVSLVGTSTALAVHTAEVLANAATHTNTASTIVKRDANGNFAAGTITAEIDGNAATATDFTGALAGDVTGTQGATMIAASTVTGKAITGFSSNAGTLGETDTLITAINKLDGNTALKAPLASPTFTGTVSGSFSGPLTGSVTGNVSGSAGSFTGALAGDITGTQSATVVAMVGGLSAVDVATGTTLANTATSANTASALVARDASGNFSAGTITAALSGNATTATSTPSFTGTLAGDVTGTQGATVIAASTILGKAITGYSSGAGTLTATDTLLSAINKLDGNTALKAPLASPTFTGTVSGSFSGPLAGNVTGDVSGSATSFTGTLAGDVTGTQAATMIAASTVTGKAITGFESSAGSITAADTLLTAINKLDGNTALKAPLASPTFTGTVSGSFSGPLTGNVTGNVSGSAGSFTGMLAGDVTGTQGSTEVVTVGGLNAADVASGATLANAATSANTASTTVKRDASGNFSAGTITANLNGNASTATTASTVTGTFAGDVTGTQGAMSISAGTVTGKSLSGFVSGPGIISSADSVLTAINKLNGNDALKAPLASPTFTGTVTAPTFVGDGSGLTGVPIPAAIASDFLIMVFNTFGATGGSVHPSMVAPFQVFYSGSSPSTSASSPGATVGNDYTIVISGRHPITPSAKKITGFSSVYSIGNATVFAGGGAFAVLPSATLKLIQRASDGAETTLDTLTMTNQGANISISHLLNFTLDWANYNYFIDFSLNSGNYSLTGSQGVNTSYCKLNKVILRY